MGTRRPLLYEVLGTQEGRSLREGRDLQRDRKRKQEKAAQPRRERASRRGRPPRRPPAPRRPQSPAKSPRRRPVPRAAWVVAAPVLVALVLSAYLLAVRDRDPGPGTLLTRTTGEGAPGPRTAGPASFPDSYYTVAVTTYTWGEDKLEMLKEVLDHLDGNGYPRAHIVSNRDKRQYILCVGCAGHWSELKAVRDRLQKETYRGRREFRSAFIMPVDRSR